MIAIASDHGGYDLKEKVKKYLEENNIPFQDFGCGSKGCGSRYLRKGHCDLHYWYWYQYFS